MYSFTSSLSDTKIRNGSRISSDVLILYRMSLYVRVLAGSLLCARTNMIQDTSVSPNRFSGKHPRSERYSLPGRELCAFLLRVDSICISCITLAIRSRALLSAFFGRARSIPREIDDAAVHAACRTSLSCKIFCKATDISSRSPDRRCSRPDDGGGLEQLQIALGHSVRRALARSVRMGSSTDLRACLSIFEERFDLPLHSVYVRANRPEPAAANHRVGIVEGDDRHATHPRLQKSVRESLVVGRIDVQTSAVEPIAGLLVRNGARESHVAQAPRVVGHARVVVFSAGYAPADERESPVRQRTRKLDRDIRALHRAEVAHPQNVDVLGVRRRTLRRLDGDVEDLALD